MEYTKVVFIIFFIAFCLQQYFLYFQLRSVSNLYSNILKKYKNKNYYVGMNSPKKIGRNVFCLIVINREKSLKELYLMRGLSTKSRFEKIKLAECTTVETICNNKMINNQQLDKSTVQALKGAYTHILNKYNTFYEEEL